MLDNHTTKKKLSLAVSGLTNLNLANYEETEWVDEKELEEADIEE